MVSIIVCSVDSEMLSRLKTNIELTIGCSYELLIRNNSDNPKGIAKVYNELAIKANGDYLCFLHEDIYIETKDWGAILKAKAKDEDTGVIGFAGARTISGVPYWHYSASLHYFFVQRLRNGELHYDFTKDSKDERNDFQRVAVLDGMFLFCKKEVWEFNPFDNSSFKGFHLYDMDFSFSILRKYKNYVNRSVRIHHLSLGSLNREYYNDFLTFYHKWQEKLPYSVKEDHGSTIEAKILIPRLVIELMEKTRLKASFVRKYLREVGIACSCVENLYVEYWITRTRLKLLLFSVIK